MHSIHFTIRQIAATDLPTVVDQASGVARPATDADLLNFGIQHLHDDLYSCVEQYRRDDDSLEWSAVGHAHVGADQIPELSIDNESFNLNEWVAQQTIAGGVNRYKNLPADVRDKVLLAQVIRPVGDGTTALAVAQSAITEQTTAIAENVGTLDSAVVNTPDQEAIRLADIPIVPPEVPLLVRVTVPMALVDPSADVVEASELEPHRWAGERVRSA